MHRERPHSKGRRGTGVFYHGIGYVKKLQIEEHIPSAALYQRNRLRTEADNEALWRGLASGDLDILATDHCPFSAADKSGHADFTTIPGGLPSIEARLSLAYHCSRSRWIPAARRLARWVEVCCANPAQIFGLQNKGHIAPGFDADLAVFDPDHWMTLQAGDTLHERVDWSPYEGTRVQGWPRDVLSRGRVIVRDGEFVGQEGWGRFVSRQLGA